MLDQVRHLVPAWRRGLIQRLGRLILVKYVIVALPIHHLMILEVSQWVFEDINSWLCTLLHLGW